MELDYTLELEDYLEYQLYYASTDEKAIAQRRKERWRFSGMSLLFGLILLFDSYGSFWSYIFIASSILFFIIYPWWSAWFYKRMYKRQIAEAMKDHFPNKTHLLFSEDVMEVDSQKGHSVFNVQDIDSIAETKAYFYIKMKQFVVIIIPKKQISDISGICSQLRLYEEKQNVSFIQNLAWNWH